MDSPVGEFKNQKSVVNFTYMGSKNSWAYWAQIFLVVGVHDLIATFRFGDDGFRGFWLAEGQILPFPIDFEGRSYNAHCRMRSDCYTSFITHVE